MLRVSRKSYDLLLMDFMCGSPSSRSLLNFLHFMCSTLTLTNLLTGSALVERPPPFSRHLATLFLFFFGLSSAGRHDLA